MAEEEAAAAPAAAAPEAEAAKDAKENGAAGDAEPKDEEVKKCDKPNKEEFDAKVQKLNDEIAELNNKLSAIDVNIAKTKQTSGGGTDDFSQAKAQMKTLRDQKASARNTTPSPMSMPTSSQSARVRGVYRRPRSDAKAEYLE